MSTFANAVETENKKRKTKTRNGMKAYVSTTDYNVDLFGSIGASRGKDIIPAFVKAFKENRDYALRILQWARDARGGAGERQIYKDILLYLERVGEFNLLNKLILKTPELGRWDDLLIFQTQTCKNAAFELIKKGLNDENLSGLVAKWLPREKSAKSKIAYELRTFLGLTPKQYRKLLVEKTNVVETKMCSKKWKLIDFSTVPSLASARYKKAFYKNTQETYTKYVEKLVKGDKTVKVNTAGLYPYDVLNGITGGYNTTQLQFLQAQWDALPNYIGSNRILPVIDVSGSMGSLVGSNTKSTMTCMDVAVSLGLYCADKNTGVFKDVFVTFSERPKFHLVKGDILSKYKEIRSSDWGYNTNLQRVFEELLKFSNKHKVPQSEMPEYIIIFSDMQFDQGTGGYDKTAQKMIEKLFNEAGYSVPNIIYWNIHAYDNVPVKHNQVGAALVSGFSPAIVKSILSCKLDDVPVITPLSVMLETIMVDRYNLN